MPRKPAAKRKPKKQLPTLLELRQREAATMPLPRADSWLKILLPLELCVTMNKLLEMPPWARKKLKHEVYQLMILQAWGRLGFAVVNVKHELGPRPLLVCTRAASGKADALSDWPKVAVDRLCRAKPKVVSVKRNGVVVGKKTIGIADHIGLLEDDNPDVLDVRSRWVKAPPGKGFAMLELFPTGTEYPYQQEDDEQIVDALFARRVKEHKTRKLQRR